MKANNLIKQKSRLSLKLISAAALLVALTGCNTISSFSRQPVTESVMVPQFSMVISSEQSSFMMGPDKNGAVYCFNKGMRMELKGYKEDGKVFINPGSIGTHELQEILYCIDPVKYGNPDNNWELTTAKRNGTPMLAKRGTF